LNVIELQGFISKKAILPQNIKYKTMENKGISRKISFSVLNGNKRIAAKAPVKGTLAKIINIHKRDKGAKRRARRA
jgi:hypothetical protein